MARMLSVVMFAVTVAANINFSWVQPSCSPDDTFNKCLRGQHCENATCMPNYHPQRVVAHAEKRANLMLGRVRHRSQVGTTTDGSCGAANGGTVCGSWPQGGCCSQYGWCGNTPAYCGAGCQSGPCSASSRVSTPAVTSSAAPKPSAEPTTDGTCGPANGGTVCGSWPQGGCCSQYGWCGKSPVHCGAGCQSGPCLGQSSVSSTPSSTPSNTSSGTSSCTSYSPTPSGAQTTDGTCGAANGGTVCGNWPQGGCCSQYGWCGNSVGCQSGPCSGSSSVISTGSMSSTMSIGSSISIGSTASSASSASSTASSTSSAPTHSPQTTDGTCGATYDNTICGSWPEGSCCSMYGYCGTGATHCGAGCQSGNCTGLPVQPAPGPQPAPANPNPGRFDMIGSSGVPAMHAGLLPNGKVVFLDKVENYTQLRLGNGQFAYSSEFDPVSCTAKPLAYKTNAFCSGGAPLADGRFMSIGGNAPLDFVDPTVGDGFEGIRILKRSPTDASLDGTAWAEGTNRLSSARWYPTAQLMPDGRVFVASGSLNGLDPNVPANNNPTYEMLDRNGVSSGVSVPMAILQSTQPYYMYPFVHLLPDGNLFVFAAKSSQIFNVGDSTNTGRVVRQLPDLAGDYRTYPNTGGSVMLPLSAATGYRPDVVICGGGPYQDLSAPTEASCGRIQPSAASPDWELESMPEGRCMVEGVLLLDGTVLFLNGAGRGGQGFGEAEDPTLTALIYDPAAPKGQRFSTAATSTVPRLYHSVSLLLPDGTVLVAGSNPVQQPVLEASPENPFPTEFRVERYTPPYLSGGRAAYRPANVTIGGPAVLTPGAGPVGLGLGNGTTAGSNNMALRFNLARPTKDVKVVLYNNGYVTHSVHMGHRMVYCEYTGLAAGSLAQSITMQAPPSYSVVPPGYYLLFVVADGVPSQGHQVLVK